MKEEPRTRVITFRVSEREYTCLKAACDSDRSSLSLIARRTMLAWAGKSATRPRVDRRLAEIDDRLDTLYTLLRKNSDC